MSSKEAFIFGFLSKLQLVYCRSSIKRLDLEKTKQSDNSEYRPLLSALANDIHMKWHWFNVTFYINKVCDGLPQRNWGSTTFKDGDRSVPIEALQLLWLCRQQQLCFNFLFLWVFMYITIPAALCPPRYFCSYHLWSHCSGKSIQFLLNLLFPNHVKFKF